MKKNTLSSTKELILRVFNSFVIQFSRSIKRGQIAIVKRCIVLQRFFSVASYYQIHIVIVNSFFIKFFRNKNSPDLK